MLQLISCPVAILAVQTVVSSFCNQANFSAVTKPKSTFLELIDHTRSPPLVSFFGAARKEGRKRQRNRESYFMGRMFHARRHTDQVLIPLMR